MTTNRRLRPSQTQQARREAQLRTAELEGYGSEDRERRTKINLRRNAFQGVFAKVNSIIAGRTVPVKFNSSSTWNFRDGGTAGVKPSTAGGAPGWTDGETVFLSSDHFNSVLTDGLASGNTLDTIEALTVFKGVNYHELAHVLFTPRFTHKPVPQIRKAMKKSGISDGRHIWHAFNILEDQRIETLFVARWPLAAHYFTLTVGKFITQTAEVKSASYSPERALHNMALSHVLLYGRRYLPAKVREESRNLFITIFGQDKCDWLEGLIDDFRQLIFPTDSNRAVEITLELAAWLLDEATAQGQRPGEMIPGSSQGHEHHRDSGAMSPADQREIAEDIETGDGFGDGADDPDDTGADDGIGNADDDADGDDAGQVGPGPEGLPGPEGPDGLPGDGSGSGDGQNQNSAPADGAGSGSSTPTHPDPEKALRDLAEAAADAVSKGSEEVFSDMLETLKTVKDMENFGDDKFGSARHQSAYSEVANSHDIVASNELANTLSQLRYDAEPSWVKRVQSGRLNVGALMAAQRDHNLDVFDEWSDSGEDATSIEVAILLDQSTSMSGQINEASHAMWVIKNACDQLEIPCTVVGYSDSCAVLYTANEMVGKQVDLFPSISGTQPKVALEYVRRLFEASDKRFKLLFTITDGQWFTPEVGAERVREINALGDVQSHLIYLMNEWEGRHSTYTDDNGVVHSAVQQRAESLRGERWHDHTAGVVAVGVRDVVKHINKELVSLVRDAAATAV